MRGDRLNLLAGLRTGDWLDAQDFPPIEWHVSGLLPEGMTVLVGPPKAGKSWLALDISLAVAAGRSDVLGCATVPKARPVLLLALEDGDRRLQFRSRHLLGNESIPVNLHYLTRLDGNVLNTIREWLDLLDLDARPLVVLDTLGRVMPPSMPGESAYGRDYRVAAQLKGITDDRPGMALLVLHHDRKANADDFVDSVSGTHGIAGAADAILAIKRLRHADSGILAMTGRDVPEAEYAVACDDGRWTLVGGSLDAAARSAAEVRQTEGLSDRSADILAYVNQHPEGIAPKDVAAKFGMSNDDAGKYLRRLTESGRVDSPKRGTYTPVRSVRMSETESPFGRFGHTNNPQLTRGQSESRGCTDDHGR